MSNWNAKRVKLLTLMICVHYTRIQARVTCTVHTGAGIRRISSSSTDTSHMPVRSASAKSEIIRCVFLNRMDLRLETLTTVAIKFLGFFDCPDDWPCSSPGERMSWIGRPLSWSGDRCAPAMDSSKDRLLILHHREPSTATLSTLLRCLILARFFIGWNADRRANQSQSAVVV